MYRDLRSRRPSVRWTSIAATSAVLAALLTDRVARADAGAAEALFNEGNKLMAEGKVVEACNAFEASNRAEPVAGTLLHLGACRERNHQLASAWSAYSDAQARAQDPVKRDIAAARLAALEPRLSYLTVSVPDSSRIDGLSITRNGAAFDPSLWNRKLPIDGGDYVIAGRAPGCQLWQTTVHVADEGDKLNVAVSRLEQLPGAVALPASRSAVVGTSGLAIRRKLALGAAGMSIAGGAAGVVLGLLARQNESEAFRTCPQSPCDAHLAATAEIHSAHDEALAANVAYGVAATAAIAAAALWFTGATDTAPRISVAPRISPSQSGLAVMGRF